VKKDIQLLGESQEVMAKEKLKALPTSVLPCLLRVQGPNLLQLITTNVAQPETET
tara:strand:- start:24 stop:188 length:165 start_codon:yes stop_codon:yes gene_type:complete